MESIITAIVMQLAASEERLEVYSWVQLQDSVCSKVMEFCKSAWPSKQRVQPKLS